MHFVGIGGAGMSGIARILLARGVPVSGSDRRDTPTLLALRALGARVEVGHDRGAPRRRRHRRRLHRDPRRQPRARRGPRARAAGAAARGGAGRGDGRPAQRRRRRHARQDLDHLDAHRRRPGLRRRPVLRDRRRPQRVGQQRARRRRATSSSPRPTRATARSCCSRRSAAIVTNVEADHLDNYGDLAAVEAAFDRFLGTVDADGLRRRLRRRPRRGAAARPCRPPARLRTYGRPTDADLRLTDLDVAAEGTSYTAVLDGAGPRPGRASRCPASTWPSTAPRRCWPGSSWGCRPAELLDGLGRFGGVHRRFELKGVAGGVRVYDDYAHHPTEVTRPARAPPARSPAAAGWWSPSSRTSTAAPGSSPTGFGAGARAGRRGRGHGRLRRPRGPGARRDRRAGRRRRPAAGRAGACSSRPGRRRPRRWPRGPAPGDLVLTMGAGDVSMVGPEVLEALRAQHEGGRGGRAGERPRR